MTEPVDYSKLHELVESSSVLKEAIAAEAELEKAEVEHRKKLYALRLGNPNYVFTCIKLFKALLFGENGPLKNDDDALEVFRFIHGLVEAAFWAPLPEQPGCIARPQVIRAFNEYIDTKVQEDMANLKPLFVRDAKE